MKWLNSLTVCGLWRNIFLKAFPPKSFFFSLNVQRLIILCQACWVHIYTAIWLIWQMCPNRDGQIDDYKLLVFDNNDYAWQERKGKKEGIRGGKEGKEKERIDRRKGNEKWWKKGRKKDIGWVFKGIQSGPTGSYIDLSSFSLNHSLYIFHYCLASMSL